jgi:hypothetical protein
VISSDKGTWTLKGARHMNNLMYGGVITLVGMGGTLVSLGFIVLLVMALKKVFPYREPDGGESKEEA